MCVSSVKKVETNMRRWKSRLDNEGNGDTEGERDRGKEDEVERTLKNVLMLLCWLMR